MTAEFIPFQADGLENGSGAVRQHAAGRSTSHADDREQFVEIPH